MTGLTRIGTLIPHFGEFASRDSIAGASRRAENLGFGSLWARDHLVWKPHGMEGTDTTFIDPFMALAAAAAVTTGCALGTAVAIPIRWPLKLAQEYASLDFLAPGRVLAGLGLGFNPQEFSAAGFEAEKREEILTETVEILRQAWRGPVQFNGDIFDVDGIQLNPKPVSPIPILYGGTTPAGVRRTARLADGWYCGRLPMDTLDARLQQLRSLFAEKQQSPYVVVQPLVVIDDTYEAAAKRIPVEQVGGSSEGARFWLPPPSGAFKSVSDLRGLVLCGTPADVVEQASEFVSRGIDEIVFDFRLQFEQYDSVLEVVGREVLPALRGSDAESTP